MLATILSAFTVAEIRKKLAFTALLLGLYRLGAHIPAPGVNSEAVDAIQDNFSNGGVLNFLNIFSGGGLSRIALFALGIMPYITASIIMQLLTVVVPSLEQLQREGEIGTQRITQYTRYLTVGLAAGQAIAYVFLFRSFQAQAGAPVVENFGLAKLTLIGVSLTAGCMLVMWMGELITQRGIGNGISLMIFASIVAGLPNGIITLKIWSGFVHQADIPLGRPEAIEAKIISEMPLPMPRWVISSPNHIRSTQPAVIVTTITNTFENVKPPSMISWSPTAKVRNRKTYPIAWANDSPTVR